MNLEEIHRIPSIYMIGIGGIGMSALARYFLGQGKKVAGYDRVSTRLTDELVREGSEIHFSSDTSFIAERFPDPGELLVIYTPAVPLDHPEIQYFRKGGYTIRKRAEMLGILSRDRNCIAVAGTHGKTTITTLIAHLLKVADIPCCALLGGISKNYMNNALIDEKPDWMVLEADEYDRSFLHLYPRMAVLSSCDPDHLDVYGSKDKLEEAFCEFVQHIPPDGRLVRNRNLELSCLESAGPETFIYGLEGPADCLAGNIRPAGGRHLFDARTGGKLIRDLELGVPGQINVENALAAISIGRLLGIGEEPIREALASFKGVKRRFDVRIEREDLVYIDDYAHHPREIEACIRSVRENFPGRKITGIFQPHLYSRTRDFAEGFAESLSALDELILLPIYPAREEPIEGVSAALIFESVSLKEKSLIGKDQLMEVLSHKKPELILTLGAGDIDRYVDPIVNLYQRANAS